jgi:hypothetical protein
MSDLLDPFMKPAMEWTPLPRGYELDDQGKRVDKTDAEQEKHRRMCAAIKRVVDNMTKENR